MVADWMYEFKKIKECYDFTFNKDMVPKIIEINIPIKKMCMKPGNIYFTKIYNYTDKDIKMILKL